ncbi:MAG: hypothetical protein J0I06_03065 [Planctomycetes bacterium]|nr:hypothetical protein [Planctomycetota bacterium]
MRTVIAVAVLAVVAGVGRADVVPAGGSEPFAGPVTVEPMGGGGTRSLVGRGAVVNPHSGTAVPVVTRLHPVVGSVQPRGHVNPLTGKTKYTSTVYNPVLGSFGTYKFRR